MLKLVLVLALIAIVAGVFLLRRSARPRIGEVVPASELQRKYGLVAENRPTIRLNPVNVPDSLRDLIPMAEKWGIGDDVIRYDFEEKASQADKDEFRNRLRGRTAAVTAWLDSYRPDKPMSEEAAAFMYMLEALDESKLWPD